MAPVEIETIPRDVVGAPPVAHLKIVDKAFELPLVSDTYNEVTRLAQPLTPFVETAKENVEKLAPILESGFISMKNKAEEKLFHQLPEGTTVRIQAKLDTAMEKAAWSPGCKSSCSFLGVAEIVCLNFFLSVVGLQLVPANILDNPTTSGLWTTVEEETVDDKLSAERIAT